MCSRPRLPLARQSLVALREPWKHKSGGCELDFDAGRVPILDVWSAEWSTYALDATELHLRRVQDYVVLSLTPAGGGVSDTAVCAVGSMRVGDPIEPEERMRLSQHVSVLAAVGIRLPEQYVLRGDEDAASGFIVADDVIEHADGDRYQGRTVGGMPSGPGVLLRANGERYEGRFVQGEPDGEGELRRTDGSVFSGTFARGAPAEEGTLRTADGTTFRGRFVDWKLQGEGTERRPNGSLYTGRFDAGLRDGRFELRRADGREFLQRWKSGQLVFDVPSQNALSERQAEPLCRLTSDRWVYLGGGCQRGLAHGEGAAALV